MTRSHPVPRRTARTLGTAALLLGLCAPVPAAALPAAPGGEVPGTTSVTVPASCGPAGAGSFAVANGPSAEDDRRALTAALDGLSGAVGAEIGLLVQDPDGRTVLAHRPDLSGMEASLSKVPLALTTMRLAAERDGRLTAQQRELIRNSVHESGNESTSALYGALGPTVSAMEAELNETYDLMGVSSTRSSGGWGHNMTTASDQLAVLGTVVHGADWLPEEDLAWLREQMRPSHPSQTWGVGGPRAGGAATTDSLVKNGWLPDAGGQWDTHSVGRAATGGTAHHIAVLGSGYPTAACGQDVATAVVELYLALGAA
ncbi:MULTISPECIES: hypothetical protein [Kocuria]|uniref:Beta-lactamase n=1 Tax=Kocuria rosea subsp. polaris TaxID=136273 RepID=A0A0W8INQ1_KOCRO|nr:hypothetical protein [Kocuria polaris]KUG61697.1 hypothetical protein AVL61_01985 [Kocuria polaris]